MSAWHEGDIRANGINIHYTRTGGDKPPLILAHGYTDNGMCWIRVAPILESTHDVIMLDARGHGKSERIGDWLSTQDLPHDLLGAVEALKLERPGVFGHSMGASAAADAAALKPEAIGYLILEDPPWFNPPRDINQSPANPAYAEYLLKVRAAPPDEMIAAVGAQNPLWHPDELVQWVESKKQLDMGIVRELRQHHRFLDWKLVIPQIQCPTLLIIGESGIVTLETAKAIAEASPHVQWAQMSGAGHSVHRENFEDSMQAVKAFLAEQTQ